MWLGKKVSVVIPAYNEEETIRYIVEEFFKQPWVDEVVVVNNNSSDNTEAEIRKTRAKLVLEKERGYGSALRRGLKEASGDLIVLCEADGNFYPKDIIKLLAYADDFDFVKGTRTRRELFQEGVMPPFMALFIIWGNIAVAKMQQFLFRGPSLTDAGCTMRLIKKEALKKIQPYFSVTAGHFLAEMTNLAMIKKIKTIEVPVNFAKRLGGYSKSGNFWGVFKIGMAMIFLTIKHRFLAWFGKI
jgi:glycosyltransferase involved in cell wall biosynthesis